MTNNSVQDLAVKSSRRVTGTLKKPTNLRCCSDVPTAGLSKFESYNFQHCKMFCDKLVFCAFQLLPFIFFGRLYCFLQESFVNHYYKVKLRFLNKKSFRKKLVQSQGEKKHSGILRLNKIMSKLLTVSKCLQLHC